MDVVDDFLVFAHMWNDIDLEATLILMHVGTNVLHRELDRVAHLLIKLHFLELVLWEYILCRAEDAFISKQLLALLLSNYLLRRLLRRIKTQRSRIESERIEELLTPVVWVHIELVSLDALLLLCGVRVVAAPLESLLFAWVAFLASTPSRLIVLLLSMLLFLLLLDQCVHFDTLGLVLLQVLLGLLHVLDNLRLALRKGSVRR